MKLFTGTLLFLALLNVCQAEDDEARYFHAAAECAKDARVSQAIKLNSGVYNEQVQVNSPLKIEISREVNEQAYLECMEQSGLMPDAERDPYLQRIRECNQGVITEKTVIGQGKVRVGSTRDQKAYEDCLRGVEVELLPTEPE